MRIWLAISACIAATVPLISAAEAGRTGGGDLRLIEAARESDRAAVAVLIRQGADVNQTQPDGATALAWAVLRGDLEMANMLIRAGADVNRANEYGETPLSIACGSQNLAIMRTLLDAGADANAKRWTGETPLMSAARAGNIDMLKLLVAHHADVNRHEARHGQTALMWAAGEGHPAAVEYLIAHGADVLAKTKVMQVPYPIEEADGRFVTGQYVDPKGGYTALFFAVEKGEIESVKLLLDAGDDVNRAAADGTTPVLLALFLHGNPLRQYPHTMELLGNPEMARFLLSRGAKVNLSDADGYTPLHAAIFIGMGTDVPGLGRPKPKVGDDRKKASLDLVNELLARGADPNARIRRNIPISSGADTRSPPNYVGASGLMLAAMSGNIAIMRALAEHGADASIAKEDGTTVLMAAAEENNVEALRLMLGKGANIQAANGAGWTAMHAAARAGANDAVRFLAENGAKFDVRDKEGNTPLKVAQQGKGRVNKTADLIRSLMGLPVDAAAATQDAAKDALQEKP